VRNTITKISSRLTADKVIWKAEAKDDASIIDTLHD